MFLSIQAYLNARNSYTLSPPEDLNSDTVFLFQFFNKKLRITVSLHDVIEILLTDHHGRNIFIDCTNGFDIKIFYQYLSYIR